MAMRRNNQKWLWWGVGILIVVVIIAVVVIIVNKNQRTGTTEKQGQSQAVESTEKKTQESGGSISEEPKKEDIKQYDGDSPNKSETLTGVISYAGVSGDDLIIRVNIDQYLTEGSCKLSLVKDGATIYSNTVAIESSVSTSTCDGFKIPIAGLPGGEMKMEVALDSGERYGKMERELSI